ncbi:MAG: hypothetical protein WD738_24650 [Pirellulales bacterium]
MRTTVLHALLFLFALCAGCGQKAEERVPVAGVVLIDGQPLTGGTIRFVPEVGRPASSKIMADGSFDLATESVNRSSKTGVLLGNYRVQVSASKIVDDVTIRWHAPERYADFRTSGLGVTIDQPTSDLVIELTWAGAKRPDDGAAANEVEAASPSDEHERPTSAVGAPASGSEAKGS